MLGGKMSAKVEQASSHNQATIGATSSAVSTNTSKISMFSNKTGFVIPKNKLSGSLVPIFRGAKKGGTDPGKEESTKPVQRKTKWGPDLTLDTTVRKGRAIAYQTRMDQINEQLSSRTLGAKDNADSLSASPIQGHEYSRKDHNELERLDLEMREAIGEILKLNPSYQPPAGYKPLLKEAKVPIPIKEYPRFNFVSLIFGPASDTHKRLEKETGARVRIYGTKEDTGKEIEITSADGNGANSTYTELYVYVSADTYEKVDAAVELIELIVTPVSANAASSTTSTTVSGDNVNIIGHSPSPAGSFASPSTINQVAGQLAVGSALAQPQGHVEHYSGPWLPKDPTQNPTQPSGFTIANPSAPLSNSIQISSSPSNPQNFPSLFGPLPGVAGGFGLPPPNPPVPSFRPQIPPTSQPLYQSQAPRNSAMPFPHPSPSQFNVPTPPQFSGNQANSLGPQAGRPALASFSQNMHQETHIAHPVQSVMSSTGWPHLQSNAMASQGRYPLASQPMSFSGTPSNILSSNMAFATSEVSGVSPGGVPVNHPFPAPSNSSISHSPVGRSPPPLPSPLPASTPPQMSFLSSASIRPLSSQVTMLSQPPGPVPGPNPSPLPMTSSGTPNFISGGVGTSNLLNPPPSVTAPRLQPPNPGDFTFQPHGPQHLVPRNLPRPGNQPGTQMITIPNQAMTPPRGSQNPSLRPAMHISDSPPVFHGFQRPHTNNPMNQRAPLPLDFTGRPTVPQLPLRQAAFANPTVVSPQMQPRNFNPSHVIPSGAPLPPRAGNAMQLPPSNPATVARPPRSVFTARAHFIDNRPFQPGLSASGTPGSRQIYDPFSPTSATHNPHLEGNTRAAKQETDPEYEDLMASVGVK